MLQLRDKWVWDFWFARDGDDYVFYLQAPKSMGDPLARHHNATIGCFCVRALTMGLRTDAASSVTPAPTTCAAGELSDPIAVHVDDSGHLLLDE